MIEERRKTDISVGKIELRGCYFQPLTQLVKTLEGIRDEVPKEYLNEAVAYFNFDESSATLGVTYSRPETDDEEAAREARARERNERALESAECQVKRYKQALGLE